MKVTLPCQFCDTLNSVDITRHDQGPKCADCGKPFLLDRPLKVPEEHFDRTVLKCSIPVLVDFYADWCAPCRAMAPILDEIALHNAGKILVAKVDIDRSPEVSERYGIRSIPYFARFENGEIVNKAVGAIGRDELIKLAE